MFTQTLEHLLDVLVTFVRGGVHLFLDRLVHLGGLLLQCQPTQFNLLVQVLT